MKHKRGREYYRAAPARAAGPPGLEVLDEVGWVLCWASSA